MVAPTVQQETYTWPSKPVSANSEPVTRAWTVRIGQELRRPAADSIRLHEMKRQKLKLKEEIEVLRGARAH